MVNTARESEFDIVTAGPDAMGENHTKLLGVTQKFGGHILFALLLPFVLQKWIDRERIGVLMLPTGPGGVFLLRRPKRCSLICVSYHTYRQQTRLVPGQRWKSIFTFFEKRTMRMADRVHCYSPDTKRVLESEYGLKNVRLLTQILSMYEWIPTNTVQKERGLCVCIARLEKRKGVSQLLDAWKAVHAEAPYAQLIIVGDGIMSPAIDRKIDTLACVKRLPFASQPALVSLVQRADIVLCPSYLEGFGLTALEAVLAGTTVIAHDTDGLRSILPHSAGIRLVPVGDQVRLSSAILSTLNESDGRRLAERSAQKEALVRYHEQNAKQILVQSLTEISNRLSDAKHVSYHS